MIAAPADDVLNTVNRHAARGQNCRRVGASPILLVVTPTARISSVSSSIPRCSLRQRRFFDPPCLRAFHSPSPSALIPVASMSRVQRPRTATQRNGDVQCLLAAAQSAEVRHLPVEPYLTQQAFDETGRLTKRHAKQHLDRQANLDSRAAALRLTPAPACWTRMPTHLRIKPALRRLQAITYRPMDR